MYNKSRILAIVPARSGSKGLVGKNIKNLCGKPLIGWSIESGLKSKYIDEVMLSTDSKEIAEIAKRYGADVPYLRPKDLATDSSTTFDVVKHVIDFYQDVKNKKFDYIVLLEPTSPLREDDDIDSMIEKLLDSNKKYDSIISIGEVHEHPSIMKKIIASSLDSYCENLEMKSRRQDNDKAYFPYGVAYIVDTKILLDEQTFYTKKNTYYEVKRYQCYEIDDIYDFLAIENIMKYEWNI